MLFHHILGRKEEGNKNGRWEDVNKGEREAQRHEGGVEESNKMWLSSFLTMKINGCWSHSKSQGI
jgi:hypothetical protein